MRADVHMHTSFSHDSQSEPREMIEGAIAKGLEVICFTDHYDKDYMGWGDESIFDADAYFETLRPLREEYREDTPVAVVYKASWEDQKIVIGNLTNIARKVKEAGITKTALTVVGDFLGDEYELSRLYDKTFTHEFRKAKE